MTTGKSEERTKWEVSNRMILYVLYKHVINSFTIFIQLTALGGIKYLDLENGHLCEVSAYSRLGAY